MLEALFADLPIYWNHLVPEIQRSLTQALGQSTLVTSSEWQRHPNHGVLFKQALPPRQRLPKELSKAVPIPQLKAAFLKGTTEGAKLVGETLRHTRVTNHTRKKLFSPMAATDCDGTLWVGDIGNYLFEWQIKNKLIAPESKRALNCLLGRLDLPPESNALNAAKRLLDALKADKLLPKAIALGLSPTQARLQLYTTQTRAMAGISFWDIFDGVQQIRKERLFPISWNTQLRSFLEKVQTDLLVIAVSASPLVVIQAILPRPLKSPLDAVGVKLQIQDGIFSDSLMGPVPYGPGKIAALRNISKDNPLLSFGDSWKYTDKELLQESGIGFAIGPGGSLAELPSNCISLPES